jgi:hypothetical protein
MVEQPGRGNQTPGVQVTHPDVRAVNIVIVDVQALFSAVETGVELFAEHTETQRLCFLQGARSNQALGLKTTFRSVVTNAGDLGHTNLHEPALQMQKGLVD